MLERLRLKGDEEVMDAGCGTARLTALLLGFRCKDSSAGGVVRRAEVKIGVCFNSPAVVTLYERAKRLRVIA